MSEHLAVSVIIPSYNCGSTITQAVDSVLAQDYSMLEIIVVDDGSTDDTEQVLTPYLDRLTYIRQDNAGVSTARNMGLARSIGAYVVFLDADDFFLPGKISVQVSAFSLIPNLDIVHSGWQIVDEHGTFREAKTPWHQAPYLDIESFLQWKPTFPGALMFRRTRLEQIGGFNPDLRQAEDVDLMLRLLAKGAKAVWVQQATVAYRQRASSAMKNGRQQAESLDTVLDTFFAQPDLAESVRRLEARARFNSYIWLVWHLHQTNAHEAISKYLKLAQAFSRFQPVTLITVLDWQAKLARLALRDDGHADALIGLWPVFQEVSGINAEEWHQVEGALNFWLCVWQHYLRHDQLSSVRGLLAYQNGSTAELVRLAAPAVFVGPDADISMVRRLVEHAASLGIGSHGERSLFSAVYFSLGLRLLVRRAFRQAVACFDQGLRLGLSARSLKLWYDSVLKASIRTALSQFKQQRRMYD